MFLTQVTIDYFSSPYQKEYLLKKKKVKKKPNSKTMIQTENVTDSLGASLETIVSKKKNSSFPRIFRSLPQFHYGSLK